MAPFFISKFEMTQAQWERVTRKNPSRFVKGEVGGHALSALHPVERVSWSQATLALGRLGLLLPTEAQWELSARGGTRSVFWTGADSETLALATNLADAYGRANGGQVSWDYEKGLDDGHTVHAPVGSFLPNPFGVHDMMGNVWEWCRDYKGAYSLDVEEGTGLRKASEGPRALRGGSFSDGAAAARSAARAFNVESHSAQNVGVRPVRQLD